MALLIPPMCPSHILIDMSLNHLILILSFNPQLRISAIRCRYRCFSPLLLALSLFQIKKKKEEEETRRRESISIFSAHPVSFTCYDMLRHIDRLVAVAVLKRFNRSHTASLAPSLFLYFSWLHN